MTKMTTLKLGNIAPNFELPGQDNQPRKISDFRGKWVLLYFYPKDDTPGCTTEACGLRDDINAFRGLKATVVGASFDSIESHKKFIAKYNLPFPLIADQEKTVAKAFGVSGHLVPDRATFVIGKDGTILYANPSVNPKTHSQEIRDVLAKITSGN